LRRIIKYIELREILICVNGVNMGKNNSSL
jgi:hypothetical protein